MSAITSEQKYTAALSDKLVDEPWRESRFGIISRRKILIVPEVGYLTMRQSCVEKDLSLWENSIEINDPNGLHSGIVVWRRDETGTDLKSAAIFLGNSGEAS